jgi:phospholipase/carboxylesterase
MCSAIGGRAMQAENLIVVLHGSGDSGAGVREWIRAVLPSFETRLAALGATVCFPSAPRIPYTLAGGEQIPVWFDRVALHPSGAEDVAGVAASCGQVSALIVEHRVRFASAKVAVVGFSQGGCLALHCGSGVRAAADGVDAVVCISSFLPLDSAARAARAGGDPPLYMCHGSADSMVPSAWGEETSQWLREQQKRDVTWRLFYGVGHELTTDVVTAALEFVVATLDLEPSIS